AGRQCEVGRGIPRGQGQGVQRAGRPGDEGDEGQGQPGPGQRVVEAEVGVAAVFFGSDAAGSAGSEPAGAPAHSLRQRASSTPYSALMRPISVCWFWISSRCASVAASLASSCSLS